MIDVFVYVLEALFVDVGIIYSGTRGLIHTVQYKHL